MLEEDNAEIVRQSAAEASEANQQEVTRTFAKEVALASHDDEQRRRRNTQGRRLQRCAHADAAGRRCAAAAGRGGLGPGAVGLHGWDLGLSVRGAAPSPAGLQAAQPGRH